MCYPKPGPRCSKHAYEKVLKTAKKLENSNKKFGEEELRAMKKNSVAYSAYTRAATTKELAQAVIDKNQAKANYQSAVSDYLSTPKGIESLKKKYGEEHPVVDSYKDKRESQMEELRKVNPKYAKKQRKDSLPSSGNDLNGIIDKHVLNHDKYTFINNTPKFYPQKDVLNGIDMNRTKRNKDKIKNMEPGESLYISYDGEVSEEPGEHPHRAKISLIAGSEDIKVLNREYNAEYYRYVTPVGTALIRARAWGGEGSIPVIMEHSDRKGSYFHQLSSTNFSENNEDLVRKRDEIISTYKIVRELEQKKVQFERQQSRDGKTPDPEVTQLFDTRIKEGYTKIVEQKTMYNHTKEQLDQEKAAIEQENHKHRKSIEQEEEQEELLNTFTELKSLSFD